MRIFLSYGRDEHVELARRLYADLKSRRHEVWFDENCLKPGFDWESHIERGLDWVSEDPKRSRVILLMTPHAVHRPSGYCLNEIARAIYRSVDIIPVMVVWCEAPLSICRIQWLDMRDCIPVEEKPERYEVNRDRLIEALEQGKLDYEGNQSKLLSQLKPLEFSAEIAKHVCKFVGRQWIFDRIDNWLNNPNASRVFWITGSPGVGKSAIAAYLCHKRREVAAFHLCSQGHDDKSDPQRCVLSIAYQLSTQLHDYHERLVYLADDLNKSAATLFNNLIVEPFSSNYAPPDRIILIVIDALDEATRYGQNKLAEFIAREFPLTPSWMRLFITSRPDPEVTLYLQGLSPYELSTDTPENLEDLRTYVCNRILQLFPNQNISNNITEKLLKKSDGLFLYIDQVFEDIKEGRLSLEHIDQFPQGLGGVYYQYFKRQFEDTLYKNLQRPLLEMVSAAKGPLPLNLAQKALGWDDYTCQEVINSVGSFYPLTEGFIQPFHRSITDWLTDPKKSGEYFVNFKEGQKRLADVCWQEFKTSVSNMSLYSISYLPLHLLDLNRWENLLELVTSPELGLIKRWVGGSDTNNGLYCLTELTEHLQIENKNSVTAAGLATQIARIYSLWAEYDKAQHWLNFARSQTSYWKGRRVHAVTLHEQASLNLYQWNFKKALRLYKRALHICLWGIPVYHDEAAANLIGLATASQTKYEFLNAIRFASKAIKKAGKAGDIHHLIAGERLLGSACRSLGKYDEADLHINAAIILCEKYGAKIESARLLLLKGWLLYEQSTLEGKLSCEGKEYFEQAVVEAQCIHDLYCLIESKMSLGWCALAAKDTAEAENIFKPLLDVLPEGRHPELRAGLFLGRAALSHQSGDYQNAAASYQDVINFCRENNIRTWQYKAMVGLGAVQWHSGECAIAQELWENALNLAAKTSKAKRALTEISINLCKTDPSVTPS